MTQRVLVTGAESFVGSHLVEQLAADGFDPIPFVLEGALLDNLPRNYQSRVVRGNLATGAGLDAALDGVTAVLHLAAATAGWSADHFVLPNLALASAVANATSGRSSVQRVVFLSSQAAVDTGSLPPGHAVDERHDHPPKMFYGLGKRRAERLLRSRLGDRLTIIRAPAVYGPRDRKLLWLFRLVASGIRPLIGRAGQQFSLIHVQDLTRALSRAIAVDVAGTFYVAGDHRATWSRVTRAVAGALGRNGVAVRIPYPVIFTLVAMLDMAARLGGPRSSININKIRALGLPTLVLETNRARRHLGFEPDIPLRAGMRETALWYRSKGWLPS